MTLKVAVDWDDTGNFTTPGDDVTADVRPGLGEVSLQYGRDAGGSTYTVAGSGGLTLDNRSRKYSSRNTASPLYGKIKPGRPVLVTRSVGANLYTLFRGETDEQPLNPDMDARVVSPSLVDALGSFRGQNISTAVFQGIRTGEAIGYVLDAVGWTGGRDLDPGATVIRFWWEDGTDALTALGKLLRSEGFPAMLTMGASGEVIFRDRFHRATRTKSTTVQGTWRSTGTVEPVLSRGLKYDDAWQNIVNTATVQVDTRVINSLKEVWRFASPIYVNTGETRTFWLTFPDPVVDAQVPDASFDDYAKVNPALPSGGTITLTRTSGTSLGITISVGAFAPGPLNISYLRLRARDVPVLTSQTVTASDSASVATYGAREFPDDLPWCSIDDAQAIVDRVVADRKEPLTVVEARFVVARSAARANALLPRDFSDRVKVIESETALNDDFHIERISHALTGEHDHEMTFTLEQVPPSTYTNLFVLNTSVLNTGVLG